MKMRTMLSTLLLLLQLHTTAPTTPPTTPPNTADLMAELRAMGGGAINNLEDITEAIQVFQQVQDEFTIEKQQLDTSTDPKTLKFWSALQAIRTKENSMAFLRSMQKNAMEFVKEYHGSNFGYGIVFYTGFETLIRAVYAATQRPPPLNIIVFGSNLGTEVLYLYQLYGHVAQSIVGVEILTQLSSFAHGNADLHGFPPVLQFHCHDALHTDKALLQNSDLIWIDNQVWDVALNIKMVSMLQQAPLKKHALIVDFASFKQAHIHQKFLQASLFEEVTSNEWRLPTSWAGNNPGAGVRVYQVL